MLQNSSVTAFTVFELLREDQLAVGRDKITRRPLPSIPRPTHPPRLGLSLVEIKTSHRNIEILTSNTLDFVKCCFKLLPYNKNFLKILSSGKAFEIIVTYVTHFQIIKKKYGKEEDEFYFVFMHFFEYFLGN